MKLTGRTSYRRAWFGKLVVTVEEGGYAMWAGERMVRWGTRFRDAREIDIVRLDMIKLDPSLAAKPEERGPPPPPIR